ncbi:amidohydrolase/deacetylase family metallohydrolase [Daejeonella sp. JGW-45]|uniref:amidohydrolase/deacetylase family metallohydrolase n=1 Tax=Daejeonella sp. JGW-45 TaxID=3034148 RepID=UPI0023ECC087|nr:amidohydrolase/deacetylase family metallohydrolase [Daejeonella sp. JGW-45]
MNGHLHKMSLFLVLVSLSLVAAAQQGAHVYRIVIKGGHVIDAKNNINELMDIAIQDGKIARVAKNIDTALAAQTVNARGMFVTPGLIDIHAHVFYGFEPDHYLSNGTVAVLPDQSTFKSGVTTVVDAGGAGWKSFPLFKKNIIDNSQTRVLSLLNIVGEGMRGIDPYEQNLNDMDAKLTAEAAVANKQHVVGFKVAHFTGSDWTPIQRGVEAGKMANMPVMIDLNSIYFSLEELFTKYLRPGDIYTHTFIESTRGVVDPIVDLKTRQFKPFVLQAQKKGIIFDVGFGGGSFNFRQALPATKAGFYPNTISTDLHKGSVNGAMKDQLNVLSVFLAMGMKLPDAIKASTWTPAQVIRREELGNLSVGSEADIAVLSVRKGVFGFRDVGGNKLTGTQKLECELTMRAGKIVYDLNAISSNINVTR